MPHIAVGSLFTECNHLGGAPTGMSSFERNELHRGSQVLELSTGTVGGMLATLRDGHAEIAPLLVASTCPGGPLAEACYRELKTEMLDRLQQVFPIEGVLLALHGSASAE